MEGQEELQVMSDHHQPTQMIIKGKRTKRQRPMSPFGLAVTSSSSSAHGGEEYGNSFTSASYESTEEEEDMANCLILLAQGCDVVPKQETSSSAIHEASAVSGHVGKGRFYVYECKTCNRTFPSFQALGGHRASHKKPKSAAMAMPDQEKKPSTTHFSSASMEQAVEDSKLFVKKSSPPPPLPPSQPTVPIQIKAFQSNNNKIKIHECSICGSEFTSGQALGGHMRRHRAAVANNSTATSATQVVSTIGAAIDNSMRSKQQQERSLLALDLNLPAPEDHDHHHHHHLQQHQIHHLRDSKFQFVPSQQTSLVFNAPALVDCHY